jgi:mono/diheme cytochrome c family protein
MSWESKFIELLVAALTRPVFLVIAALLVLRLFRIQHPASGHAVWTAVLVGMLVVPLVSVLAPHYEFAVLPAAPAGEGEVSPQPDFNVARSVAGTEPAEMDPLLLREQGVSLRLLEGKGKRAAATWSSQHSTPFILYFYLAGFVLMASYNAIGWFLLRGLVRRSDPLRSGPLRVSKDVVVPAAVGLFRPAVLLPADWRRWTIVTRRDVLAHEFAHIRRLDLVTSMTAHCIKCILWFNPLVWWVARQVSRSAEMACDVAALESRGDPTAYSRMLLEFAGRVNRYGRRATVPGLAMTDSSGLGKRIEVVFAASARKMRRLSRPAMMMGIAGMPFACMIAIVGFTPSIAAPVMPPPALSKPPGPPLPMTEPAPVSVAAVSPIGMTPASAAPQSAAAVRELINDYCVACHKAGLAAAGVRLDDIDAQNPIADASKWERILRTLRLRSMPPAGMPRADRGTNDSVVAWLERALDSNASPATWPVRSEPLSDQALAARLSTFLWNSTPDDELQNLAGRGRLKDAQVLEQQVKRMLADPKSRSFMSNFFGGWLNLINVAQIKPSPERFPDFDEALRAAMLRETEMFLDSQVREDHPALELLTANYTFLNDRLARHYGIRNLSGGEFRRVELSDSRRSGILGHASILSVTSYPERISPNLRGKWILTTILGQIPPDPPPMVPSLPKDEPGQTTSVRALMEKSVASPRCASCHVIIDPPGYALENFNAIGQWQDTEGATPVDASGAFPDGARFDGPAQFRAALLDRREAVLNNIAERLLAFGLGRVTAQGGPKIRAIDYYELPAVRGIVRDAAPANHRWSALITAVVKSAPFQTRRID